MGSIGTQAVSPYHDGVIPSIAEIVVRVHRPVLVAGLILGLCSAAFLVRPGLREDYTIESLIAADDVEYHRFREFSKTFVSGEVALFVMDAGDPLEPNNLELLHWICEQCRQIEGVESPMAISELPDLGLWALFKPGGELQTIYQRLSEDATARDGIEQDLRDNPLVIGNLVGRDPETDGLNTTAGVLVQVKGEGEAGRRKQVADQLRGVLAEAKQRRPDATILLGGPLVGLIEIFEAIHHDMAVFTILTFILICVALWLIFRRVSAVLVAVMTAGLATISALGVSVVCDLPMSLVSQTVVVLVMVLSVSMCVHLLVAHDESRLHREGEARGPMHDARRTVGRMLLPCSLVTATTALGLASLFITTLRPIKQLAALIIFGIVVALLLGLSAIPGLARLSARKPPSDRRLGVLGEGLSRIARLASSPSGLRTGILAAFAISVCFFAIKVPTALSNFEGDFVKNFRKDSNVRRVYQFVQENLGPVGSIEVIVRREDGGPIIGESAMQAVEIGRRSEFDEAVHGDRTAWSTQALLADIRRQLALQVDQTRSGMALIQGLDAFQERVAAEFDPPIRKSLSLVDLVKLASVGRLLGVAMLELPRFEWQFAMTMVMIDQKLSRDFMRNFVSADGRAVRVHLRALESDDVHRKLDVARRIATRARHDLGPDYDVEVTGLYPLYAKIAADLLKDQLRTFSLALILIASCMCAALRSIRLGLLSMVPNLMPMVFCLGVMGWANIPINMATAMMLSVALGIAVDNTVHYLWRFRRELEVDGDYAGAIARTHRTVGRACVFNSIVIVGGFWVLCLSNFIPTVYFGMMIGLTMIGALAGDIVLLPMLLTLLRPVRASALEV